LWDTAPRLTLIKDAPHRLLTREILSRYPAHMRLEDILHKEYGTHDARPIAVGISFRGGGTQEMKHVLIKTLATHGRIGLI